eukprot:238811_1
MTELVYKLKALVFQEMQPMIKTAVDPISRSMQRQIEIAMQDELKNNLKYEILYKLPITVDGSTYICDHNIHFNLSWNGLSMSCTAIHDESTRSVQRTSTATWSPDTMETFVSATIKELFEILIEKEIIFTPFLVIWMAERLQNKGWTLEEIAKKLQTNGMTLTNFAELWSKAGWTLPKIAKHISANPVRNKL